jgi:hypothetical protein
MKPLTSLQYFLTLTIVFVAMLIGQLVFVGMVSLIQSSGVRTHNDLAEIFQYLVPLVCVVSVALSYGVSNWLLQRAKSQSTLGDKLLAYRGVLLTRYALLEAPSLFSTVAYLLTGYLFFVGISLAVAVLFVMSRPSAERAAADLSLDFQEKAKLNDPQAIVVEVPRY